MVKPRFYKDGGHHDSESHYTDFEHTVDEFEEMQPAQNGDLTDFEKRNEMYCTERLQMMSELGHDRVTHSAVPFSCSKCNASLYYAKEFNEHIFDHELKATEPTGISYICFKCDESFDLPRELIDHIKAAH